MTHDQLALHESQLQHRGYRKYMSSYTYDGSYTWWKSFDNATGDKAYQLGFRVWDWTPYPDNSRPQNDDYSIEIIAMPLNHNGRIDLRSSWLPIADIDTFEQMAKDFYQFTHNYINYTDD